MTATESSVRYAAETKLLALAYETAQSRNLKKKTSQISQGTKIFLWLQALDYGAYLTFPEREKIWRCLADIAEVYEYPIAPVLNPISTPIFLGTQTTVNNTFNYSNGTPFLNSDIDTGTEVVDSFAVTAAYGAVWFYTLRKGSNQRSGVFQASWLSTGASIATQHDSTDEIGDTSPVTIDVDFNAGDIRLIATVTSDDWILEGLRTLIYAQ